MILNDPKTFAIDVVGSITQRQYTGLFKIKPLLSHREKLRKDEYRRQLLGANTDFTSQEAAKIAGVFSSIWAHMVDAPSWWKEAGNGVDLIDEEPVIAVLDKIDEFQNEIIQQITKSGENSKKELSEIKK